MTQLVIDVVCLFTHDKASLLAGMPRHFCPNCQKSYCHKTTLLRHQRYECGQPPQFRCPECFYKFRYRSDFLRHMARKHSLFNWVN
ncbi:hypothetical protein PR048_000168 [Dryococelus australis]|uniref:C2H2-type domain-containing protein n=1 Tax=Dryococelus australis TaxID=614101 RepID=A0ABQ9IEU4_9NEOP|nr:hypothetical protein PR048_000168 [Dryococelus australis]